MDPKFITHLNERGMTVEEYSVLAPELKAPIAASYNPQGNIRTHQINIFSLLIHVELIFICASCFIGSLLMEFRVAPASAGKPVPLIALFGNSKNNVFQTLFCK
jgi:hypothetical protein